MSLTIRLSRIGRKNQPAYKLVVSNTRDKRNGKYVDDGVYYINIEAVGAGGRVYSKKSDINVLKGMVTDM